MGKVYTITSGKGGVGKTTTAINLAAVINELGHDVLLIDANLETPNVGLHFGAPVVPVSLNHVLSGEAELHDAIYEHDSGVKVMPASISLHDLKDLEIGEIGEIIKKVRKHAEYVIVDSAPGLGDGVLAAMKRSDEVLVVTNPNILSVTDALKVVKLAEELGANVCGTVVNRVKRSKNEMSIDNIKEMLERPIVGVVPEDRCVEHALAKKEAVVHAFPKSRATRAYYEIVSKLLGRRYAKKLAEEEKQGMFRRVLRAFGFGH